jgi:hypothetical protein
MVETTHQRRGKVVPFAGLGVELEMGLAVPLTPFCVVRTVTEEVPRDQPAFL